MNFTDKQSYEADLLSLKSKNKSTPQSDPYTMLTLDWTDPQGRATSSKCPANDDTQQFETKSDGLPLPNKDDTAIYQLELKSDWHYEAKVTERGGEAEGLYSSWFNVKLTANEKQPSIALKKVEWQKIEDITVAIIPKSA